MTDRLQENRRRYFVGRDNVRSAFRSAVVHREPPFTVLFVHGAGGTGKTALLGALADVAVEAEFRSVTVDLAALEATPAAFLGRLEALLGADVAVDRLDEHGRLAVLIDNVDAENPLEVWLRDRFIPGLRSDALVVLAARSPPSPAWLSDAGWRHLVRVVEVGNLESSEARRYLEMRRIDRRLQDRLVEVTHGHPLALCLVADLLEQRPDGPPIDLADAPDVVRTLLERFVDEVPDRRHRDALAVCAHARFTDEPLLRSVLGGDDADALLAWLRSRSFVDEGRHGISPHELARDVLEADLRWRNRVAYEQMHHRVRAQIVERIRRPPLGDQQRAAADLLFLHRQHPVMRPLFDWSALGRASLDRLAADDVDALVEMTERHQGAAQSGFVAHWLEHQPDAFVVFRVAEDEIAGFTAVLRLDVATPEAVDADPGAAAMLAYWDAHDRPGPGDAVTAARFFVDRTHDQAPRSASFAAVSVAHIVHALGTAGLACDVIGSIRVPEVASLFEHLDFRRAPEADFDVDGHHLAFARDFRRDGAEAWLDMLGAREVEDAPTSRRRPPPTPPAMSRAEVSIAVRAALRELHRPDGLAANPLVGTRQFGNDAGEPLTAQEVASVLGDAIAGLGADPRDAKAHRAIDRTYLRPAETQERAAEVLDLPFSTYRRHLARGVERIVDQIWARRQRL